MKGKESQSSGEHWPSGMLKVESISVTDHREVNDHVLAMSVFKLDLVLSSSWHGRKPLIFSGRPSCTGPQPECA